MTPRPHTIYSKLNLDYLISIEGNVYSNISNKHIIPHDNGTGYMRICLRTHVGKQYVHRLVGEVYVAGYKEELHINHKDGKSNNNIFTNLEWVTPSQNNIHKYKVLGYKVTHTAENRLGISNTLRSKSLVSVSYVIGTESQVKEVWNLQGTMPLHKIASITGINKNKVSELIRTNRVILTNKGHINVGEVTR